MEIKNKKILVLGLGISGVSTVKALNQLGANIIISDTKSESELKEALLEVGKKNIELFLGGGKPNLKNIDLIIKSPGIPINNEILKEAYGRRIEIITDIELAYRLRPDNNFIAITGTNGKTTTTTLVGEMFKKANRRTYIAGNIGVGILWDIINSQREDIFVIEASSFQLESTKEFNPKVSAILNITSDHLDWHGTFENYLEAKKKVFKNQRKDEYTILNYDDSLLRDIENEVNSNIVWFSLKEELPRGVYIHNEDIVINDGNNIQKVINIHDVKILGKHNLENTLASISIGWVMGIDLNTMREVLQSFPGVEHRIEYVGTINGIKFYNDSKGTNINASIKAIEALKKPIILIAGGMDQGSDFDDLILSFDSKVKGLILLGESKKKIKDTAIKHGFTDIYMVEDMDEAVIKAYELAERRDSILLSPSCASWDMYSSFEERGKDFKGKILKLKEDEDA